MRGGEGKGVCVGGGSHYVMYFHAVFLICNSIEEISLKKTPLKVDAFNIFFTILGWHYYIFS